MKSTVNTSLSLLLLIQAGNVLLDVFGRRIVKAALLSAGMLGCVACSPAGPMQHSTLRVGMDNVKMARVNINMVGDLKVSSGSEALVNASFDYNFPDWQPTFTNSGRGEVTINQGPSRRLPWVLDNSPNGLAFHLQNAWTVQLNRNVPMDLVIRMVVHDADLKLGDLDLRRVQIEGGASHLKIDLRGSPRTNYDVSVHGGGGPGEAQVNLPAGVGIDATVVPGYRAIDTGGLLQDGHRYYNDSLGKANVAVHLDLDVSGWSIRLIP